VLMITDYITGVMVGYTTKKLSSATGIMGIFKKVGIVICVMVACMADKVIGTENTLRLAIILTFAGNEGISILENVAKLGVPIPQRLLDALLQLKGKGGNVNESK
ncbi:MAG: phage holin family protein, partial [Peptostreptococcaceae bacterium]